MENKKLLKYLLKDLSELDEMFTEKGKNCFDELEMEFIQNRVTGAKRLVQLFFEHENDVAVDAHQEMKKEQKTEIQKTPEKIEKELVGSEEKLPGNRWVEENSANQYEGNSVEVNIQEKSQKVVVDELNTNKIIPENKVEEKSPGAVIQEEIHETKTEEKIQVIENRIVAPEIVTVNEVKIHEQPVEVVPTVTGKLNAVAVQQELQMEDEEPVDIHNKRLGDSFSKERSVNDLMSADFSNLEHKLSNRPVTSIQSAVGINDRFQYIRELFEGSTENFTKTVTELDSMNDIREAVNYLQANFKWKKNDTSLKFVHLVKRRFSNE
jgi:hypothetical protein